MPNAKCLLTVNTNACILYNILHIPYALQFCRVYILRIYNFCGFAVLNLRLLGTVVLKHSQVAYSCDIFVNIRSESEYHNVSEQRCKMFWTRCWICLKMSSYQMESCI